MPSWSENGAKKCHILVKSFTYKSDLKKKKKLIIVGVIGNLENYTTRKYNPTNDSFLSSRRPMCQKGLNRNHESILLWS